MSLPDTLTNVSRFGTPVGVQPKETLFKCHFLYNNNLLVYTLYISSSLHKNVFLIVKFDHINLYI